MRRRILRIMVHFFPLIFKLKNFKVNLFMSSGLKFSIFAPDG